MSQAQTAKEVLIAAKWILENVGWCQHSYTKTKFGHASFGLNPSDTSCACATGSILLVDAFKADLNNGAISIMENIVSHSGDDRTSLAAWNDQSGRTKEEVLALFDKGIKAASKKKVKS